MNMKMKKLVSLLLAIVLIFSLMPVFAGGANAAGPTKIFFCSFETDDELGGWEFPDADGDGHRWKRMSDSDGEFGATDGSSALFSFSYDNSTTTVLYPDNWAYTPEISIPAQGKTELAFDVFAQDPGYWAEQYSVYVRPVGGTDALIFSETLAEGEDRTSPAHWTLDLSAYAGKTVQIAFRHHGVSDVFAIGIDSVAVWNEPTVQKIGTVAVCADEPVAGMSVTSACDIPAGSGYTVANVTWEPGDANFQVGKTYSVAVSLEARPGYEFSSDVKATINGNAATIISRGPEEMKISYTFPKVEESMPSMFFSDVKTKDWFYGDVEYVYYNKLMNGEGNNKFNPQGKCTRAMIVTILYRMEGSPKHGTNNPFNDVRSGQWYTDAVIWAAENNIVNGVGGGKFNPDGKVTREELATILCRFAKAKGLYSEEDCAMLAGFADYGKVSGWAQESMSWAVGVGLVGGSNEKDGLYLLPRGNALRCQVAAIFHRFCDSFHI